MKVVYVILIAGFIMAGFPFGVPITDRNLAISMCDWDSVFSRLLLLGRSFWNGKIHYS